MGFLSPPRVFSRPFIKAFLTHEFVMHSKFLRLQLHMFQPV